ncbi:MAG TPA: NfeD family protein [Cyclobacteriaceae bacterium]|jgi:membrane-bound ClpP family serine protease|nr:NfeD family protein [Cyclobacteriaceae bacterium]
MIEWITVISLVFLGLALIVAEIIFVPGTTLVGVVGFAFLIVGVGLSFRYFGNETGWITVGATSVVSGAILYFSFSANVWGKFSLKTSSEGKVNEGELDELKIGVEGHTISALRPVGKAELNNKTFEVKTLGEYLDSGKRVRVIKISSNQIFVEPIN